MVLEEPALAGFFYGRKKSLAARCSSRSHFLWAVEFRGRAFGNVCAQL